MDKLRHNAFTIVSLVSRDFKVKYRRSILGFLWSILNPLLMMIVVAAVFSYMFRFDIENFPLYLILGQTLFSLMTEATTGAMTSIISSASLIKKIRINKMVFPIEKVLFAFVNFAISLLAVIAVMLFFKVLPTWNLLLLPLLLILMFAFCLGLGLLLAALAVFFRDIVHLWSVLTTAWMYLTPLFYPTSILRDWMLQAMQFNPMYHYVNFFREIVLWGTTPAWSEIALCFVFAMVMLLIGVLIFRKMERKFILYV